MKEIPLTQGKVAIVDDEDFEWLSQWRWYYTNGYAARSVRAGGKKMILMHREICKTIKGMETDHQDGDRLNNQRTNLRSCTHSENQQNTRMTRRNKSGYKGVSYFGPAKKWKAKITLNGNEIFLGYFFALEDAAYAYDNAAKELFGEFACTNFQRVQGNLGAL